MLWQCTISAVALRMPWGVHKIVVAEFSKQLSIYCAKNYFNAPKGTNNNHSSTTRGRDRLMQNGHERRSVQGRVSDHHHHKSKAARWRKSSQNSTKMRSWRAVPPRHRCPPALWARPSQWAEWRSRSRRP